MKNNNPAPAASPVKLTWKQKKQKATIERLRQPSKVELQLVKKDGGLGELALKVTVHSKVELNYKSFLYVDPDADRLEYRVMVAAGAIAEHLNEQNGDNHDPDECARAGARLLAALVAQGQQANKKAEGLVI